MVLVTGATGFVGSCLCQKFFDDHIVFRRALRFSDKQDDISVGEIGAETDWSASLANVDCVVHLAACVQVANTNSTESLDEFRRVNVNGTLNLAKQAAAAGVRRFIYLSSIKVNGEGTSSGSPYTAEDLPAPIDPYGISKHEAEIALQELCKETDMDLVIIRPPLVYGPGVKANFLSMLKWLNNGIPLPFGAIRNNKRSLVSVDNLVDLVIVCINHPDARNQIFLVSDDEDLSTTDLLKRIGNALEKKARLIPIPIRFLSIVAFLLRKQSVSQRLLGSLQLDISKTREILGWAPIVSVDQGLERTAHWYINRLSEYQCDIS